MPVQDPAYDNWTPGGLYSANLDKSGKTMTLLKMKRRLNKVLRAVGLKAPTKPRAGKKPTKPQISILSGSSVAALTATPPTTGV